MRSPSALSTSIMLSLLIILAGVLLIIFIQFDRGYKLPTYTLENNHIVKQPQQKQSNLPEIPEPPAPLVVAPPRGQAVGPIVTTAPGQNSRQTAPLQRADSSLQRQDYVPYDVLLDSPWSPYYQPPRFETNR